MTRIKSVEAMTALENAGWFVRMTKHGSEKVRGGRALRFGAHSALLPHELLVDADATVDAEELAPFLTDPRS